MSRDDLLASLEQLHLELQAAESLDEDSRERLRTIAAEIQAVLSSEARETASEHTLRERLRELALEFETEYPRLTGAVVKLADMLAAIGI